MKKIVASAFAFALLVPFVASAHAVVSPSQTVPSKYETFSLGVPVEKDMPTTAIRILIPEGVDRVTPLVKPGWRIDVVKNDAGTTTEIRWTGGTIPAGQKDVFSFSARTADHPVTLAWKAYQTYADGSVVAWDQDPGSGQMQGDMKMKVANPYSTTDIAFPAAQEAPRDPFALSALCIALIALVFSAFSFVTARKKTA